MRVDVASDGKAMVGGGREGKGGGILICCLPYDLTIDHPSLLRRSERHDCVCVGSRDLHAVVIQ